MTTLRAFGTLLASDDTDRTLTYRLLPFGEPGRTSAGVVTASAGTIELPADPADVIANMEHDPLVPVGRAVEIVETPDALVGTFRAARTPAGDAWLAEAREGLRAGISVELDGIVIRSGALLRGRLTGAGAVTTPAFPSALLVASDTEPADEPAPDDVDDPVDDDTDPDGDTPTDTPEEDPMTDTLTAAAPAALPAPAAGAGPDLSLAGVTRLLASLGAGRRSPELLAALTDVTQTANPHVEPAQFLGEIWRGNPYARRIVPLFGTDTLTSYKVTGWAWKDTKEPAGADYAGDKTAVPSNAVETEPVEYDAARWAGAHDVDRKFRDFGDESFWASYWRAMAASWAKWSDAKALAAAKAAGTAVTPGAGADVIDVLVECVISLLGEGTPSVVLLGKDPLKALAKIDPKIVLTGSLSLPSLDGEIGALRFGTHPSLAAGDVLMWDRNAATWYELGEAPIRVETVDLVKGGIDVGAFGYGVLGVHDAKAIVKATYTPPAPAAAAK